jgi:hypothetical protein
MMIGRHASSTSENLRERLEIRLRSSRLGWSATNKLHAQSDVPRSHADVDIDVYKTTRGMIASGPFAGMEFVVKGSWGNVGPMLVGCYEREIHRAVEAAISRSPRTVVVVGAAEGYYAVGLARRLPSANVVAVDIDPLARVICAEVAIRNGVEGRVEIREACHWNDLEALAGPITLVICDSEGFEVELLDPARVPDWRRRP